MVNDYKDRLAEAMKDAGLTTADLARELKLSYQAVKKVLDGGQFGLTNNQRAAKRLGVRSEWLATGKGLKVEPTGGMRPELREIVQAFEGLKEHQVTFVMEAIRGVLDAAPLVPEPADQPKEQPSEESSSSRRRML